MRTVSLVEPSVVSFLPISLFIQSACWELLLPDVIKPGTTRGMVAVTVGVLISKGKGNDWTYTEG